MLFVVGDGPLWWRHLVPETWIGCRIFPGDWMGAGGMCIMEEDVLQASVDAGGFGFLAAWVLAFGLGGVGRVGIHCVVMVVVLPVICRVLACVGNPSVVIGNGLVCVVWWDVICMREELSQWVVVKAVLSVAFSIS
jgi:hypothetical protein